MVEWPFKSTLTAYILLYHHQQGTDGTSIQVRIHNSPGGGLGWSPSHYKKEGSYIKWGAKKIRGEKRSFITESWLLYEPVILGLTEEELIPKSLFFFLLISCKSDDLSNGFLFNYSTKPLRLWKIDRNNLPL